MTFGRDRLHGSLDLLVLSNLAGGPRYGYQILASLRERSGGRIILKAGTLYPILHKLERDKCVRTWWDDATGRDRKWYALTERGRKRMESRAREWLDYAACVRGLLGPLAERLAPPSPPLDAVGK
ncbi:MAG: PadR family transcriptional regulator [Phycisphaerae bacterium]|jgi:DNA-binding PadR family transcriptional regulator|nr:PadR family transcriptional regulator [Phycisphaerae bacterium]MCZ2400362.1 PadR family transcriptional regulator [Phycisphaerae bacterium]